MLQSKSSLIVLLLLSASFIGFIPEITQVHASNPSIVQQQHHNGSNEIIINNPVTAGNLLTMGIAMQASNCTTPPVISINDSRMSTWTSDRSLCFKLAGVTPYEVDILSAISGSSGTEIIDYHYTPEPNRVDVNFVEFSSVPNSVFATGNNTGTCGPVGFCNPRLVGPLAGTTIANATLGCSGGGCTINGVKWGAVVVVFDSSPTLSAVAVYPTTKTTALSFGPGIPNPESWITPYGGAHEISTGFLETTNILPGEGIVVVPCNFFQLQCWWYPALFMSAVSGFFLAVGGAARIQSKGMTYLLLTALTLASLMTVQMGMLSIMFPLMFTFLTILYALATRERNETGT